MLSAAEWSDDCEEIVRRFEDAWRSGDRPSVTELVPVGFPQRIAVLTELLHMGVAAEVR